MAQQCTVTGMPKQCQCHIARHQCELTCLSALTACVHVMGQCATNRPFCRAASSVSLAFGRVPTLRSVSQRQFNRQTAARLVDGGCQAGSNPRDYGSDDTPPPSPRHASLDCIMQFAALCGELILQQVAVSGSNSGDLSCLHAHCMRRHGGRE